MVREKIAKSKKKVTLHGNVFISLNDISLGYFTFGTSSTIQWLHFGASNT